MKHFDLTEYWDMCKKPGDSYNVHWVSSDGSCYGMDKCYWTDEYGGCMRQDDFSIPSGDINGQTEWMCAWYLKNDPERGILEIADIMPKETWIDKMVLSWSPYKRMTYAKGKEIYWGKNEVIGSTKEMPILINPIPPISAYLPPIPGGWWCRALQIITYEEYYPTFTDSIGRKHNDVIKINMMQPFEKSDPNDHSNHGAIYYLKKGVGRIGVEWTEYDHDMKLKNKYDMVSAVYDGIINLPAK